MTNLDYSLKTSEERTECVKKVIASTPKEKLTPKYLNYLGDYILFIREKGQTKQRNFLTKNRETIIKKREISYEDMVSTLEGGEDALHTLINNDKNQLLDKKEKVTEEEIKNNTVLQEKMQTIKTLTECFNKTKNPSDRFKLKQQIIETWQEIYIVKATYKQTTTGRLPAQIKTFAHINLEEKVTVNLDGTLDVKSTLSLLRADHISFLLNYYAQLKQEIDEDLNSDLRWLLIDLENLVEKTLTGPDQSNISNTVLYDLLIWKIDGLKNKEIVEKMQQKHGIVHSEQYYSTLWRKHLPNLLSKQAKKDWIIYHYTQEEYGLWKKCTKCNKWKIANPLFFDRSKISKDGFYPQCKECRSTRNKKKK